jgi:hypothetical protein
MEGRSGFPRWKPLMNVEWLNRRIAHKMNPVLAAKLFIPAKWERFDVENGRHDYEII